MTTPPPLSSVRVVMSKWGDRPHWEFDALFLGSDEHGDWCGIPAGTKMSRPGAQYVAPVAQVGLSPSQDSPGGRWWLATFHDVDGHYSPSLGSTVQTYVDMTTPPVWDGAVLRAVDLDLDVIRGVSGRVWVDDEDEFAQHRVRFGYPEDVVAQAMASCDRVHAAMREQRAPYDGTAHLPWLARVRDL